MTGRRVPGSTLSPCDGNPFDLNRNNTMSARKHITNTLLGAALGLAALCAAVSCGKVSSVDAPVPSPSFTVDDGGAMGSLGIATRSVLSAPDIETRKTSVTLAAYSRGVLYASGHFTSGLDGMRLDLQEGETYDVVALVNMGDMRSSLPSSEDGLASVTYTVPGYAEVNSSGIPMSGRLDGYRAGPSRGTVPVRRLFAKVTANLELDWPGASFAGASVRNMNGVLAPFGESAVSGASQVLSWNDSGQGSGTSCSVVLYVPENRQGSIGGGSVPRDKSHERIPAIDAVRERLTYIETRVTASGQYEGGVTYRSYLGSDAVSDFDVIGNTHYIWNLRYTEEGLAYEDWKTEKDLADNRFLRWRSDPIEVSPGQAVTFADWYSTNITSGVRAWSGNASPGMVSSSDGNGFTVSASAVNGMELTAWASPSVNPTDALTVSTVFRVRVNDVVTWVERLELSPSSATVAVGNSHDFNSVTLVTERYVNGALDSTERTPVALGAPGLTWTSAAPAIAAVSSGRVTGVSVGETVITATYAAPRGGNPSATCAVTVYRADQTGGVTVDTGWDDAGSETLDP